MTKTPAPRNKTIFLSDEEIEHYSSRSITLTGKTKIEDILDKTIYPSTFCIHSNP